MMPTIIRDPEIMHGTPLFRETRVPSQTLFDCLESDLALEALREAKHLLLAPA